MYLLTLPAIVLISFCSFAADTDEVPKEIRLPTFEKIEKKPKGGAIQFSCKDGDKEFKPSDAEYENCISKVQSGLKNEQEEKKKSR